MRITRLGEWTRSGLLGTLAIHTAVFFIFVLIVSFATIRIEDLFVAWIGDASALQVVTVLVAALATYVAIETVLLMILMQRYVTGPLAQPWAQREWLAYVMIGGTLIATLTSPLTFGTFALVLPGLPELIVFFLFPYVTKAIKADGNAETPTPL